MKFMLLILPVKCREHHLASPHVSFITVSAPILGGLSVSCQCLLSGSSGKPETQMSQYKLEPEPAEVPRGSLQVLAVVRSRGWLTCRKLPGERNFLWTQHGGELVPSVPWLLMCGWKKGPEGHKSVGVCAGPGPLTGPLWGHSPEPWLGCGTWIPGADGVLLGDWGAVVGCGGEQRPWQPWAPAGLGPPARLSCDLGANGWPSLCCPYGPLVSLGSLPCVTHRHHQPSPASL